MTGDQIRSLQPALAAHLQRFKHCFRRKKSLDHCQKYVLGLLMELKRKSVEPIALATEVPVRTLQEFLAFFAWDHQRVSDTMQVLVAEEHASDHAIGLVDASAHPKSGDKTPGVARQWCGRTGKVDNCVVGQHLLYTDNDPDNQFSCVLASDLFLPESWARDRDRCHEAGVPEDLDHRPKWRIALEQIRDAIKHGVVFEWLTFDADYGQIPPFWFELDTLGQRAVGEVRSNFRCWTTRPWYRSLNRAHASKRVVTVCRHSPVFTQKPWRKVRIKETTRGPVTWEVKAARVHLVDASSPSHGLSSPTDRRYWLIVARNVDTREVKYFVSNAPAGSPLKAMLQVAFSRWHIEKWVERAKQETGFGDFEVRTYTSLIRHWLCSRLAMFFLASETTRLRGEKSPDHLRADSPSDACIELERLVSVPRIGHEPLGPVRVLSAAQRRFLPEPQEQGGLNQSRT